MDEERYTAVEIKLSYLEDLAESLQKEILRQSRAMEALKNENKLILEKLRSISDRMEEIPDKKPPHY
ncbi:SlyX family protein [Treponema parvum]|uniref:SlyX family protein n=1 Tax=Treponema parvum TaxID=138851 RepID=UPI001AEBF52F|nr:SlyX family protein [Treponema parvum]QTQ15358.1 SlyX family protein [Treponema parvum]